jgi:hypothetical protein
MQPLCHSAHALFYLFITEKYKRSNRERLKEAEVKFVTVATKKNGRYNHVSRIAKVKSERTAARSGETWGM